MTKTLYVMRHAKSSWDDPSLSDLERPLTPRGEKAARRMASQLERAVSRPTLVLCSPATRARRTCEVIAHRLGATARVQVEAVLYGASGSALLERLRELPEEEVSVLLVGHNPGLFDLVVELAGSEEAAEAPSRFPTAAVAIFRARGRWSELGTSSAALVDVLLPNTS